MPQHPALHLHLITCPARAAVLAETLASLAGTDRPWVPAVDFATLYNPGLDPRFFDETDGTDGPAERLPPMRPMRLIPSYFPADPRTVIGAPGRLISRWDAAFLVKKSAALGLRQDLRFARLAAAHFGAVWGCRPSLVQHRAAPSTWAGPAHTAWNFDAEWRAG